MPAGRQVQLCEQKNILHEFKLAVDLLHVNVCAVCVHIDICVNAMKGERKREKENGNIIRFTTK